MMGSARGLVSVCTLFAVIGCGDSAPVTEETSSSTGSPTTSTGPASGSSSGPGSSSSSDSAADTTAGGSSSDTGPVEAVCGNGYLEPGEECDDANSIEWDGCSTACEAGYLPDPVTMGLDLPAVVPVLRVDVGGQAILKDVVISGQLEIFEEHDGTLADLDAIVPTTSSPVGFQGRGNFTWTLPKKGYGFELQDGAGGDVDLSILGLPPGSDFALYACYSDKTCMRNALVFALGQQLGRWSPRTRFVELVIDGEYLGLYMVWERIRRDVARCDIDKPAPDALSGDISGGYILRLEGGGKGQETVGGVVYDRDFVMDGGRIYTYHYPQPAKLTPEQAAYLPDFVQAFEDAMALDPSVYPTWIDVPSWVDRAVVEELTNNWDGYVHSIYMTKASQANGGRLGMGPLWDYDLAFANGNVTGYNCQTDNWAHEIVRPFPDDVPSYWSSLFADDEFLHAFKCRWQDLRNEATSLATFEAQIAAWVDFTADARARDQARWSTVGSMIFPNCFSAPSYEGEVTALLDWIEARLAWLDAQAAAMPGACP